jgi:lysyl-tRNA synthetase class 1
MPAPIPPALREAAKVSKAWPYEEARKLLKRYPDGPGGKEIVFETGYGPSGLPHLGTFQEVARTLMVRHALAEIVDWPSRLIAFSDDMDGMRKVPPGVPHQDMMHEHLDQPLSRVPDPFGCGHESYADHNNGICSASSSTGSASTTSSSPRPPATPRAGSTRR